MRRVLVDTSIWIDFFRQGKSSTTKKLKSLLEKDAVCTTAIIKAEICSGAQNEKQFRLLQESLSSIPLLDEPSDLWRLIAYDRFRLARRGIQASLPDLAIATLAVLHNVPLYTRDKLFSKIEKFLPFQLYK